MISRQLVEMHGGRIWAEGKSEGGGSESAFAILAASTSPTAGATPAAGQAA